MHLNRVTIQTLRVGHTITLDRRCSLGCFTGSFSLYERIEKYDTMAALDPFSLGQLQSCAMPIYS